MVLGVRGKVVVRVRVKGEQPVLVQRALLLLLLTNYLLPTSCSGSLFLERNPATSYRTSPAKWHSTKADLCLREISRGWELGQG